MECKNERTFSRLVFLSEVAVEGYVLDCFSDLL